MRAQTERIERIREARQTPERFRRIKEALFAQKVHL
jgi:hypothetical protein